MASKEININLLLKYNVLKIGHIFKQPYPDTRLATINEAVLDPSVETRD